MPQESLLYQLRRGFEAATDSKHSSKRHPNLLIRRRGALSMGLTKSLGGRHLLGALAEHLLLPSGDLGDAYSRKCVGWHLSR